MSSQKVVRHRNSKPLPPTSDKCDGTKGEVFLGDSSSAVVPEGKFTINPVHKKGGVDIKSYKCGCYKPSQIYILQSRTNTKHENRPYRLWMARLYQKEEWLYQGVGKGVKGAQESSPISHRAMFKLCAKKLFLLSLLIKKKSAVYSADRCNFSEPETD